MTHMACRTQTSIPRVVVLGLAIPDAEILDAVRDILFAVRQLDLLAEDFVVRSLPRRIRHCATFAATIVVSDNAVDRTKPDAGLGHTRDDVVLNQCHVIAVARADDLTDLEAISLQKGGSSHKAVPSPAELIQL